MMPASDGPSMFLPASMEWQAWHFLKTRRPAEASPAADILSEAGVAAFGAGGGALEAGGAALAVGAGDCPIVALGGEALPAAI